MINRSEQINQTESKTGIKTSADRLKRTGAAVMLLAAILAPSAGCKALDVDALFHQPQIERDVMPTDEINLIVIDADSPLTVQQTITDTAYEIPVTSPGDKVIVKIDRDNQVLVRQNVDPANGVSYSYGMPIRDVFRSARHSGDQQILAGYTDDPDSLGRTILDEGIVWVNSTDAQPVHFDNPDKQPSPTPSIYPSHFDIEGVSFMELLPLSPYYHGRSGYYDAGTTPSHDF